jgi:hypothetical protein
MIVSKKSIFFNSKVIKDFALNFVYEAMGHNHKKNMAI